MVVVTVVLPGVQSEGPQHLDRRQLQRASGVVGHAERLGAVRVFAHREEPSRPREPMQHRPSSPSISTHRFRDKSSHDWAFLAQVYAISWLQSKTGTECASVSTDGQVLFWDTRKLGEPVEHMSLEPKSSAGEGLLGGVSLDFGGELLQGCSRGAGCRGRALIAVPPAPACTHAWLSVAAKAGSSEGLFA